MKGKPDGSRFSILWHLSRKTGNLNHALTYICAKRRDIARGINTRVWFNFRRQNNEIRPRKILIVGN